MAPPATADWRLSDAAVRTMAIEPVDADRAEIVPR
jgi:hypothetical protein